MDALLGLVLAQGRTFTLADVSAADLARVRGERFRVLTAEQRAADPELRNPQGHLSALSQAVAAKLRLASEGAGSRGSGDRDPLVGG